MKVVALVSGGKDSCYAMMKCLDYGHEIVALANLLPADDSVDELDSHMYQTVGHQILVSYAECMGLPMFRRRIRGCTRHQQLGYRTTPGDEVEDMFALISKVRRQIPSVTAVSSGAIASDYQRLRVESVCSRLGLVSLAYLWKQDQSLLLQEMIENGIVAIIAKVAALGLNPMKHLGTEVASLQSLLHQLQEKYGINVCGEGGEYETLTLDCPLFKNARILLDKFEIVLQSPDSIAPVGVLHPVAFHLEYKKDPDSLCSNSGDGEVRFVQEVHEGSELEIQPKCHSDELEYSCSYNDDNFICSRTKGNPFTIGCCLQDRSSTPKDLQRDLAAVLKKIESKLGEGGYGWADVIYIHLYIADMKDFTLANETYVRFITEAKCHLGVPSRSTIQLPLAEMSMGKAYVEILVASDQTKRVLHVQSISCWAPSCIGPYSQATLHKNVLHMAGQLGLDPPTMMLRSGGPSAEMEQALKNCEAIANCFNCSLVTSAILLVVYCSASLSSRERTDIQKKLEAFLGRSSFITDKRSRPGHSEPICLYVLAPHLPKSALVEVKPVLYAPEENESTSVASLENFSSEIEELWGFQHTTWQKLCWQNYVIHEKFCFTVVHITAEIATQICSDDGAVALEQFFGSEMRMRRLVRFCIYLLDMALQENYFSWSDIMSLRIYFATSLCLSAGVLSVAFMEAFGEFAKISDRIEMGKEPIFNLIPVLGSGRDACISDLFTCEISALKNN